MLTRTDKFTISPIYLSDQIQVRGDALRRLLEAKGYTHIHIDDDDRFSAMNPYGIIEENSYCFMKKMFV